MKKNYRVTETGLDVLNIASCEKYGLIEVAEPEKTEDYGLSCTSAFLAIGANQIDHLSSKLGGQLEHIFAVLSFASFINNVANWLLENNAIGCVWAYDVDESLGLQIAKLLVSGEKVNIEKLLCERFEELGEQNIGNVWRECPLLSDYLKSVEVKEQAVVNVYFSYNNFTDQMILATRPTIELGAEFKLKLFSALLSGRRELVDKGIKFVIKYED